MNFFLEKENKKKMEEKKKWVEIRKSKVHGKGVFAIKNIPKGTVVTTYDGRLFVKPCREYIDVMREDILFYKTHSDYMFDIPLIKKPETGFRELSFHSIAPHYQAGKSITFYIKKTGKEPEPTNVTLVGYSHEDIIKNPSFGIGSMINDAYRIDKTPESVLQYDIATKEFAQIYLDSNIDLSSSKYNCALYTLLIMKEKHPWNSVITIRDIKKGEELFWPYGKEHWQNKLEGVTIEEESIIDMALFFKDNPELHSSWAQLMEDASKNPKLKATILNVLQGEMEKVVLGK